MSEALAFEKAETKIKHRVKRSRRLAGTVATLCLALGAANGANGSETYKDVASMGMFGSIVGGSILVNADRRRMKKQCRAIVSGHNAEIAGIEPPIAVRLPHKTLARDERIEAQMYGRRTWQSSISAGLGATTAVMSYDIGATYTEGFVGLAAGSGLIYLAHSLLEKNSEGYAAAENRFIGALSPPELI